MSQFSRYLTEDSIAWLWRNPLAEGPDQRPHFGALVLARPFVFISQTLDPQSWQQLKSAYEAGTEGLATARRMTTAIPFTEITALVHIPEEHATVLRVGSGSLVTNIGIGLKGGMPRDIFDELHFELAPQVKPVTRKMTSLEAALTPLVCVGIVVVCGGLLALYEALRTKVPGDLKTAIIDVVLSFFTAPLGVVGIAVIIALLVAACLAWMGYRLRHRPDVIELDLRVLNAEGLAL